ncbi:hypothetical protein ACFL50_04015 [Candidatus Latescibacterota bacterium]
MDTIFYSWQSDLPNNINRTFIQKALEKSAKMIKKDDSVQVEPVVDRDTDDVPGTPDIGMTIFDKIDSCAVFICDVSIINKGSIKRKTPNPNVLIELGYALKSIGWERILMVQNVAFGKPEKLPFDLNKKRVIPYKLGTEPSTEERGSEKKALIGRLSANLKTVFKHIEQNTMIQIQKNNPIIDVIFDQKMIENTGSQHIYQLRVEVSNKGNISVKNWKLSFIFPMLFDHDNAKKALIREVTSDSIKYSRQINAFIIEYNSTHILFPQDKIILSEYFKIIYTINDYIYLKLKKIPRIKWQLFADDMPPKEGEVIIPNIY